MKSSSVFLAFALLISIGSPRADARIGGDRYGSVLYGESGARITDVHMQKIHGAGFGSLPEYRLEIWTDFNEVVLVSYFTEGGAAQALAEIERGKSIDVSSCVEEEETIPESSADGCSREVVHRRESAICGRGDRIVVMDIDSPDYHHERIQGSSYAEIQQMAGHRCSSQYR